MEKKEILRYMKKVQKRVFLREAAQLLLVYLSFGLGIGILINVISLLVPFYRAWELALGAVLLLFLAGICFSMIRFPGKKKAACLLDGKGLQERVTTALEQMEDDSEIVRLQRRDTVQRLQDFSVKESFPLQVELKKLLVLFGLFSIFTATALLPSKAKEEAVKRHELSEQANAQVQRAEEFKKLLDTEKELKELLPAEAREELKKQLDQSIQELSSAKSKGELQKAQTRLEKKAEKALEEALKEGGFEKLSPEAASLVENYLPGTMKKQQELAENAAAGEEGTDSQSGGSGTKDGGKDGEGSGNGQSGGTGAGSGGKDGQNSGNGRSDGSGTGTGGGYNYGSNQGIEKADNSNRSTPEQITIPGRKTGSDENLTGTGENGTSYSQKGTQSEGFSGEVVDYGKVLGEYSQAAYGQLEDGSIPAGMESVVKNYFDGLNE